MKMKTNRKVKKLFSYVLTAAMVITAVTPAFAGKVKAVAAGLTLTEQSGWLESAYVEWQPVKNAEVRNDKARPAFRQLMQNVNHFRIFKDCNIRQYLRLLK